MLKNKVDKKIVDRKIKEALFKKLELAFKYADLRNKIFKKYFAPFLSKNDV